MLDWAKYYVFHVRLWFQEALILVSKIVRFTAATTERI